MVNTYEEGIQYADEVISGKILACEYVVLACKRFKKDLKNAKQENSTYIFRADRVNHFLGFTNSVIKHVKGNLANEPFILAPWQVMIACNLFGFVFRDDPSIRRFKNCLLFVSRKAGKSALSSILPIYEMLVGDEGAEIYSIATKKQQAKIVWQVTKRMCQKLPPEISKSFQFTIADIRVDDRFCVYMPLGRDSDTLDGLNPSLSIFDESAAITDRNLIEVITSASGARDNYLNVYISTASFTKDTIFYENLQYCRRILKNTIEDDTWFAMIYENTLEDFNDPNTWVKSNPNIGISLRPDFLKNQWHEAKQVSNKKANFLVKYLNLYQSSSSTWLTSEDLEQNYVDEIDRSFPLFIGVDLGMTSDLTALSFVYVPPNGEYQIETKCFLPKESVKKIPRYLQAVYAKAISDGELITMNGRVTDFEAVAMYISDYIADKELIEVCYDPSNSHQFALRLESDGINTVSVSQRMTSLSPAAKELERVMIGSKCKVLKNKFFAWQFSNTAAYIDINNNLKLRKGDDNDLKIDAVIATNIALAKAMDFNIKGSPSFEVIDF